MIHNFTESTDPRWLFICSAGLQRSPTGAALAIKKGIDARSCGTSTKYALIPLSANLIKWADKIIFVNMENYEQALISFEDYEALHYSLITKSQVLDIQDIYVYNDPDLIILFEQQIDWVRAFGNKTSY